MGNTIKKRCLYIFFIIIMLFSLAYIVSIGTMHVEINQWREYIERLNRNNYDVNVINEQITNFNVNLVGRIIQLIIGIFICLVGAVGVLITWKTKTDGPKYLMLNTLIILITLIFAVTITHSLVAIPPKDRSPLDGKTLVVLIFSYLAMAFAFGLYFLKADYKYLKGALTIVVGVLVLVCCSLSLSASTELIGDASILGIHVPVVDKRISADTFLLLISIILMLAPLIFMINFDGIKVTSLNEGERPNQSKQRTFFSDTDDKLRSLKKLLDDGIITEEEYQEKRKKYIDLL